jgi:hypothetical protein
MIPMQSFSSNHRNGIVRYHVVQVPRPILVRKEVLEVHRFEVIKSDERISMEMDVTFARGRGPCEPLVKRRLFDVGFATIDELWIISI